MKNLTQIILVNHDNVVNNQIQNIIRECGISANIKIALNGGHALLYLNHLQLCNKTNNGTVLVILNMNTPVVDGVKFLSEYKSCRELNKENICIVVINDAHDDEKQNKALSLGVNRFIEFPFSKPQITNIIEEFKEDNNDNELVMVPRVNLKRENHHIATRYNVRPAL